MPYAERISFLIPYNDSQARGVFSSHIISIFYESSWHDYAFFNEDREINTDFKPWYLLSAFTDC